MSAAINFSATDAANVSARRASLTVNTNRTSATVDALRDERRWTPPTPTAELQKQNTRRAQRAAVWAWCAKHDLPPLPAPGQDVADSLAGERGRKLSPETLTLRREAMR